MTSNSENKPRKKTKRWYFLIAIALLVLAIFLSTHDEEVRVILFVALFIGVLITWAFFSSKRRTKRRKWMLVLFVIYLILAFILILFLIYLNELGKAYML